MVSTCCAPFGSRLPAPVAEHHPRSGQFSQDIRRSGCAVSNLNGEAGHFGNALHGARYLIEAAWEHAVDCSVNPAVLLVLRDDENPTVVSRVGGEEDFEGPANPPCCVGHGCAPGCWSITSSKLRANQASPRPYYENTPAV
jgi:hypothetical protein